MKPIPDGYKAHHSLIVRNDMTVDFEQPEPELGSLHPVYATNWLTKHMELVSRKLILPFLDSSEEGLGFEVRVKHIASALPGMQVSLEATRVKTEGPRIYARCNAVNELGDKISEGETTQIVMSQAKLVQRFSDLKQRWESSHG